MVNKWKWEGEQGVQPCDMYWLPVCRSAGPQIGRCRNIALTPLVSSPCVKGRGTHDDDGVIFQVLTATDASVLAVMWVRRCYHF